MEDLFSQLIPMIVALGFVYWYRKVDSPGVSPFKASLFYFFVAMAFIFQMLWYTAETTKIFCGVLASHFIFVAAVHLITNDSEKYQQEASIWVTGLTGLMMGTGVLMLAMDYSNTKSVLNLLIVGSLVVFLVLCLTRGEPRGVKKKIICNFCFFDTLFKPVWVALRSIPHGVSATLPPS